MNKKRAICSYTAEGRKGIHDSLETNKRLMIELMQQPLYGRSCEYADNRIALFSAQVGKCAVTGQEVGRIEDFINDEMKGRKSFNKMLIIEATPERCTAERQLVRQLRQNQP